MFYWIWSILILAALLAAAGWVWSMWGKVKQFMVALDNAGDLVERLTDLTEEILANSADEQIRPLTVAQARQLRENHRELVKLRRQLRLARAAQHWSALWGNGPVGELVPGRQSGRGTTQQG